MWIIHSVVCSRSDPPSPVLHSSHMQAPEPRSCECNHIGSDHDSVCVAKDLAAELFLGPDPDTVSHCGKSG